MRELNLYIFDTETQQHDSNLLLALYHSLPLHFFPFDFHSGTSQLFRYFSERLIHTVSIRAENILMQYLCYHVCVSFADKGEELIECHQASGETKDSHRNRAKRQRTQEITFRMVNNLNFCRCLRSRGVFFVLKQRHIFLCDMTLHRSNEALE